MPNDQLDTKQELTRLIAYTKNYIEYQRALGLEGFVPRPASASPSPERRLTLDQVREELGDCQRCKLCSTRTHLVFGDGDPQAKLVFVGEGPGRDEDLQGLPFVGRAGQLLTRIIQSINLQRSQVYICNIIKCRPPGNRNPEPDEIAACEPFLVKQLEAIQPQLICALGKFAAQTLLRTQIPISKLRGQFQSYHGIRLMPTFHPAYLLRNPKEKRLVWEDMQLIQREYFTGIIGE